MRLHKNANRRQRRWITSRHVWLDQAGCGWHLSQHLAGVEWACDLEIYTWTSSPWQYSLAWTFGWTREVVADTSLSSVQVVSGIVTLKCINVYGTWNVHPLAILTSLNSWLEVGGGGGGSPRFLHKCILYISRKAYKTWFSHLNYNEAHHPWVEKR